MSCVDYVSIFDRHGVLRCEDKPRGPCPAVRARGAMSSAAAMGNSASGGTSVSSSAGPNAASGGSAGGSAGSGGNVSAVFVFSTSVRHTSVRLVIEVR